MTANKLISPDDFNSAGLALLWAALQAFADDGWDYEVVQFDNFLKIHFDARGKHDDFEGIHRLVRALHHRDDDFYLIVSAHDGVGYSREWFLSCKWR